MAEKSRSRNGRKRSDLSNLLKGSTIAFASDSTIMIDTGQAISNRTSEGIAALFLVLRSSSELINLRPGYTSLLVEFDPFKSDPQAVLATVNLAVQLAVKLAAKEAPAASIINSSLIEIPVRYGGDDGPDLLEVSRMLRLPPEDVIRLHTEAEYRVAFLGFSPGFPYLVGLPRELHCPRREVPRLQVPKGSVAIGGEQTGIYPEPSPGGWQVIGRTDLQLFDFCATPQALLSPGDRVRFVRLE